jgi:sec-independent protein translocase protein TatA
MVQLALIGTQEWVLILIIVLILFGARKLPDLARSLGSSVNEFKKGMAEGAKDDPRTTNDVRSSTSSTPSSNGPTSTRNDR